MDVTLPGPSKTTMSPASRRWLAADHVRPWFQAARRLDGRGGGPPRRVRLDQPLRHRGRQRARGFCQSYPFSASGEDWNGAQPVEARTALDYLVGEPTLLRRGIAAALAAARALAAPSPARSVIAARPGERASRGPAGARLRLRRGRRPVRDGALTGPSRAPRLRRAAARDRPPSTAECRLGGRDVVSFPEARAQARRRRRGKGKPWETEPSSSCRCWGSA